MLLTKTQFQICIRPSPDERNTRHPIFAVDCLPRSGVLLRRQDACLGVKLRASHGSANRAGCDPDLRIVANPLCLPHVAPCHYEELAFVFAKPHWSGDAGSYLAKRGQRNIFLAVNGRGNLARHAFYLSPRGPRLDRNVTAPIAPIGLSVLQA